MEKEEKQQQQQHHHGIDLQWGKRLRRFKEPSKSSSSSSFGITRRKMSTRHVYDTKTTTTTTTTTTTDPTFSPLSCLTRVTEGSRHGKSPSPDKEERYYSTRGSAAGDEKENGNGVGFGMGMGGEEKGKGKGNGKGVWPKLYISLSSKEKEEDFLAMKGCKLPQRPKKRAKLIQRTLLLVSPGAWLTDMCQERYEVREKKTPKKRPRGLKAMGNIVDSDTE